MSSKAKHKAIYAYCHNEDSEWTEVKEWALLNGVRLAFCMPALSDVAANAASWIRAYGNRYGDCAGIVLSRRLALRKEVLFGAYESTQAIDLQLYSTIKGREPYSDADFHDITTPTNKTEQAGKRMDKVQRRVISLLLQALHMNGYAIVMPFGLLRGYVESSDKALDEAAADLATSRGWMREGNSKDLLILTHVGVEKLEQLGLVADDFPTERGQLVWDLTRTAIEAASLRLQLDGGRVSEHEAINAIKVAKHELSAALTGPRLAVHADRVNREIQVPEIDDADFHLIDAQFKTIQRTAERILEEHLADIDLNRDASRGEPMPTSVNINISTFTGNLSAGVSGNVTQIHSNIQAIQKASPELADSLAALTKAISDTDLPAEIKGEALEHVDAVVEEVKQFPAVQKPVKIRNAAQGLIAFSGGAASLCTNWEKVQPYVDKAWIQLQNFVQNLAHYLPK